MIENKIQLIEAISEALSMVICDALDEAREAVDVFRDEDEREAMLTLILDVTQLVRQVLKDQEDY